VFCSMFKLKEGVGWVLVFDSSSVRKANHGRGRNGMSHSFSFSVLVCSQSNWREEKSPRGYY
jgi:hypothetical protein